MSRLNPREATEDVTIAVAGDRDSDGPLPGSNVTLRVAYRAKRQLVRDREGAEVVSEATLLAAPEHNPGKDLEQLLSPGTKVTVRGDDREVMTAEPALRRGRVVYVAATLT
ncbi:MAG: hypothetical protein IE926_01895 [Micrococcales bacterium]|nr:hypothetical protein [Micrococcales bacterium]